MLKSLNCKRMDKLVRNPAKSVPLTARGPDMTPADMRSSAKPERGLGSGSIVPLAIAACCAVIGLDQVLHTTPAALLASPLAQTLHWAGNVVLAVPFAAVAIWAGGWLGSRLGINLTGSWGVFTQACLITLVLAVLLVPAWFGHYAVDSVTQAPVVPSAGGHAGHQQAGSPAWRRDRCHRASGGECRGRGARARARLVPGGRRQPDERPADLREQLFRRTPPSPRPCTPGHRHRGGGAAPVRLPARHRRAGRAGRAGRGAAGDIRRADVAYPLHARRPQDEHSTSRSDLTNGRIRRWTGP